MIWGLLLGCREVLTVSAPTHGAVQAWDEALHEVVTEQGYVDYDALEFQRAALEGYVAWIARDDATRLPGKKKKNAKVRNLRHAFWINAYNALTLYQVLERERPASVLDVPGWLPTPGSGFFVETAFKTGTTHQSLSEIEHERLRMRELDYRDHAAINCASRSCPPLRAGLFHAAALNQELDAQMARWVADPERGLRFEGDTLRVSPIFQWFATDFHFTSGGLSLCAIAASHAEGRLREQLLAHEAKDCPHTPFSYDWSLNDSPPTPP